MTIDHQNFMNDSCYQNPHVQISNWLHPIKCSFCCYPDESVHVPLIK